MRSPSTIVLLIAFFVSSRGLTAEHRVEVLNEAPPVDELSDDIAAQLSKTGYKVIRGTSRTVCEFWPCQQWPIKADFKPSAELLYPFQPGQLFGVLRYRRRGADFRDQEISSGVYTLRYDVQPVDGNHEGTSPTRDFLLMVRADADESVEPMDPVDLSEVNAESAETSHPAMLCLQKVQGESAELPSIRHDEDRDWWMVRFAGKGKTSDQTKPVVVEMVVAGVAPE